MATLLPWIPKHQNRGDALAPGLHEDGRSGHHRNSRARVCLRHGKDQGFVFGTKRKPSPVAARREAAGAVLARFAQDLEKIWQVAQARPGKDLLDKVATGRDEFPFVGVSVPSDDDRSVAAGSQSRSLCWIRAVVEQNFALTGERGAKSVQRSHDIFGTRIRRSLVAGVGNGGKFADDGEAPQVLKRQQPVVLEDNDRLRRGLAGERGVDLLVDGRCGSGGKFELRRENTEYRIVHTLDRNFAFADPKLQIVSNLVEERHLNVLTCPHRLGAIAQAEDEVSDYIAAKAPALLKNAGEQHFVLAAVLSVDRVVGAHDARHTCIYTPSEVRQIDLMQGARTDLDVNAETRVLHRIQRVVLGTGHRVTLHAAHCSGAEACKMFRVFSVSLLRTAPSRMTRQIDADATEEIPPQRTNLTADRLADPFFKIDIESCSASHGNGECRRSAHDDTTGSIEELQSINSKALDDACIPSVGTVAADHHVGNAGVECVRSR